jgi:hypothetical protein
MYIPSNSSTQTESEAQRFKEFESLSHSYFPDNLMRPLLWPLAGRFDYSPNAFLSVIITIRALRVMGCGLSVGARHGLPSTHYWHWQLRLGGYRRVSDSYPL